MQIRRAARKLFPLRRTSFGNSEKECDDTFDRCRSVAGSLSCSAAASVALGDFDFSTRNFESGRSSIL